MKRHHYKDKMRLILTSLIVHDGVLAKVYRGIRGNKEPFGNNPLANLVTKWCFDYFGKYGKAPGIAIQQRFHDYAESSRDPETVDVMERLLSDLSTAYKAAPEINEQAMVDVISKEVQHKQLDGLIETIQSHLSVNEVSEAQEALATHHPIDFSSKAWGGFLTKVKIDALFRKAEMEERILIRFGGKLRALGKFISPHLIRGGFISFCGPDKVGKSFWLQEIVWQAIRQRRKVLYYVLGDMTEEDVERRICSRLARMPWDEEETLRIPERIRPNGREPAKVRAEMVPTPMITASEVKRALKRLHIATALKEIPFKSRFAGGNVIAASDVEQDVIQEREEHLWIPDVIVIDYADLLLHEVSTKNLDIRHRINETWMILRRIAADNHCLVVTATQTAATAYGKSGNPAWVISKRDFSEDKRKNSHVTGMIGINQTVEERSLGIYRLNWVVGRGKTRDMVWTAGNLAISSPAIVSAFDTTRRTTQDNTSEESAVDAPNQKHKGHK